MRGGARLVVVPHLTEERQEVLTLRPRRAGSRITAQVERTLRRQQLQTIPFFSGSLHCKHWTRCRVVCRHSIVERQRMLLSATACSPVWIGSTGASVAHTEWYQVAADTCELMIALVAG
jgi:hypothetical protein